MATIENLIHNLPDLSKLNFRYAPIVSRLLPGVLMVILVFLIAYRLAGFTVLIFQQDADTTPVHTGTQGGHKWEYRIFWVGNELESSPLWKEGGYPIWVRFEVVFDNNSAPDPLFWEANTLPRDLTCPF